MEKLCNHFTTSDCNVMGLVSPDSLIKDGICLALAGGVKTRFGDKRASALTFRKVGGGDLEIHKCIIFQSPLMKLQSSSMIKVNKVICVLHEMINSMPQPYFLDEF